MDDDDDVFHQGSFNDVGRARSSVKGNIDRFEMMDSQLRRTKSNAVERGAGRRPPATPPDVTGDGGPSRAVSTPAHLNEPPLIRANGHVSRADVVSSSTNPYVNIDESSDMGTNDVNDDVDSLRLQRERTSQRRPHVMRIDLDDPQAPPLRDYPPPRHHTRGGGRAKAKLSERQGCMLLGAFLVLLGFVAGFVAAFFGVRSAGCQCGSNAAPFSQPPAGTAGTPSTLMTTSTVKPFTPTGPNPCKQVVQYKPSWDTSSPGGQHLSQLHEEGECRLACESRKDCLAIDYVAKNAVNSGQCYVHTDPDFATTTRSAPGVTQYRVTSRSCA